MRPDQPSPRHRSYLLLLLVCLAVMVALALPSPWNRLASPGYLVLALSMISLLGRPLAGESQASPARHLFRALGIGAMAIAVVWGRTPMQHRDSGIVLILLWSLFTVWSSLRLIRSLASERWVNPRVLMGATAGYLMLGLTAGMLCSALEILVPGSFTNVRLDDAIPPNPQTAALTAGQPVWTLSFVRLNYYAFVSLTTMGYGDVLPTTPPAQMLGVAIAVLGTFYVAVVMGLLISRLIAREAGRH